MTANPAISALLSVACGLGVDGTTTHRLHMGQKTPELLGLRLEPVVGLGHMFFNDFGHLAVQCGRWKLQVGLSFAAVTLHLGTGIAGDFQHGGVFAQGMDKHHADAFIGRMHRRTVKQPGTVTLAACRRQHRNAELGADRQLLVLGAKARCAMAISSSLRL
jgi:hypothetical protein